MVNNPNAEVVVLPSFTCVGKLVPVAAISVALTVPGFPNDGPAALPEHLEEIIAGSHPSLGNSGRQLLRTSCFVIDTCFGAGGASNRADYISTARNSNVGRRPVRCRPRRLAPAGLRKEQTCVQEMLHRVRSSAPGPLP